DYVGFVKGVDWGDINNDGLPDLFISSLGNKNKLFINRGGTNASDWKFEDISFQARVEEPIFSFPTWFFDYDNDGFEDLFVAGYDLQRLKNVAYDIGSEYLGIRPKADFPKLYRNNGDETFTDVTEQMQLDKIMYAMGSNYGDLDNDGYLDFYIGTGEPDLRSVVPNRMFKNKEGKSFTEVTMSAGFGHIQKGHGVGFGDFDNDGDQDIYCVIGGAYEGDISQNVLFENSNEKNAWITIQAEGRIGNRDAIGAKIKVNLPGGRTIYRTVGTGGTFGSSSLQQEIGLGKAQSIRSIEITWPRADRTPSVYTNVPINRIVKIIEGENAFKLIDAQKVRFKKGSGHAHHHNH
ncbi:MAG: CRTAC1 family protein, partial [Bacteroidota bacterium]